LNLGVSRNRFCDFLADPDSRSFSRFGAVIMQVAVCPEPVLAKDRLLCCPEHSKAKPMLVGVCFVCVQAGFFLSFIGLCFGFVNGVVVPWLIVRMSAASIMTGAKDALFAPVVH
jgi:hypothetical protein